MGPTLSNIHQTQRTERQQPLLVCTYEVGENVSTHSNRALTREDLRSTGARICTILHIHEVKEDEKFRKCTYST